MLPTLRSFPEVLQLAPNVKVVALVFNKPHQPFFPGTQLDYISQPPLELDWTMLLSSGQWKEGRSDGGHPRSGLDLPHDPACLLSFPIFQLNGEDAEDL